ncbi:MAG: YybH family protein [Cyclobacteriaceae bacterium]
MKNFAVTLAVFVFAITCQAQEKFSGSEEDIGTILKNVEAFSQYYVSGDYESLANSYTMDGKIFPSNADIIEGRVAIKKRWILPDGVKMLRHKVSPKEITVIDETAYDYGYYEGDSQNVSGEKSTFKGKYVIVWKKVEGDWKIYLDIWNSLPRE